MTPSTLRAVADALGRLADELSDLADHADADGLVTVDVAAQLACTSIGVVRRAISRGELPAYGGERDRSVRRCDLSRWVDGRRVSSVAAKPTDDEDIDRRMRRIARRSAA